MSLEIGKATKRTVSRKPVAKTSSPPRAERSKRTTATTSSRVESDSSSISSESTSKKKVAAASSTSRAITGRNEAPPETHAIGVEHVSHDGDEHDPSGIGGLGGLGDLLNGNKGRAGNSGKAGGYPTKPDPNDGVIERGLESGEPQSFVNNNGDSVEFEVQQVEGSDDFDSFTVKIGEDEVRVNVSPDEDAELALARVTDFYSQQDDSVRGAVNDITINSGPNPSDDYWAEEYDSPGFVSAATGGGGKIDFWNGTDHLVESVFNHEYGHNIGNAVRNEQNDEGSWIDRAVTPVLDKISGDDQSQNVPRGHSDAIEADGNSVSDYGDNAIAEDFAETYEAYRVAEESGPAALEEFRREFPERAALLDEEVFTRDLEVAA